MPGFMPPPDGLVPNNVGGGAAAGLFSTLFASTNPVSAGLSALGALGASAGPSNAESNTGAITPTGWGTFNNPFIIASGGSTVKDVTTRQDGEVKLDQDATGGTSNGGVGTAPFIDGGGGFTGLIIIGAVAFVLVGVLKRGK